VSVTRNWTKSRDEARHLIFPLFSATRLSDVLKPWERKYENSRSETGLALPGFIRHAGIVTIASEAKKIFANNSKPPDVMLMAVMLN
jgi:hypothetical protein